MLTVYVNVKAAFFQFVNLLLWSFLLYNLQCRLSMWILKQLSSNLSNLLLWNLIYFTSWKRIVVVSFQAIVVKGRIRAGITLKKQRIFIEPECSKSSWSFTSDEPWKELDFLNIWWSWCLCFDLKWQVDCCFQKLLSKL